MGSVLVRAWIAVQVELHGQYSIDRLCAFQRHSRSMTNTWLSVLCMVTPIPCLMLNTVMDFVPLEQPNKGRAANYLFWGRFFISLTLLTFGVLMQFVHLIPRLGMTRRHVLEISIVTSTGCLCFNYWIAGLIAFPVPFMLLVGTPTWFIINAIMFYYYFASRLRQDAVLLKAFIKTMAILVSQISLTIAYPAYILGLVSVSQQYYGLYVAVLPVIKIASKNAISALVGDNDDVKPEIVIFNVEIFNALYVSLAMQNSSNVSTTLMLFLIDFAQAWASMVDVKRELHHLQLLMAKIPNDHVLHGRPFLEVAHQLAEDDAAITDVQLRELGSELQSLDGSGVNNLGHFTMGREHTTSNRNTKPSFYANPFAHIFATTHKVKPAPTNVTIIQCFKPQPNKSSLTGATSSKLTIDLIPVTANTPEVRRLHRVFTKRERLELLRRSTRLLFIVEFVILVEYTEVVVPVIYSKCRVEFSHTIL